jgi:tRNA threonylcarbamoyl adenosine modification protein (Sua5/YciO/YrdC/YwlC family)
MGRVSEGDGAAGYRRFDCNDGDPAVVEEAAESARQAIERGDCIVLPTDTVYGIGADAFSAEAVQRLLNAKNRGRDMPPPVLIADASLLRALTVDVPQTARDLVQRHWPGALTIICKAQPSLRMDLGETEGTIALRVPDHTLARDVLRRTGPMAVSSANISGHKAAVTCDQAVEQLGDRVAVYLDGGALPWHGEPSTIVDFASSSDGVVLRKGALSVAEIRQVAPSVIDPDEPQPEPALETPTESEEAAGDSVVTLAPPATDDPSTEPAQVWSKDAGYASSTGDGDDRYHEPTTDELGITHPAEDPDQPSLFERSGDSAAADGEPTAPQAIQDESPRTPEN